jgi:DNA-binding NarL/FixJ family response regulator
MPKPPTRARHRTPPTERPASVPPPSPSLPTASPPPPSPAPASPPAPCSCEADDQAGVRVLCVDDHAVLVEGLKAQFAIDGHIRVVGRLGSAEHLLDEVERLRPDVVLLDIEMPGPDVFEMADRLRCTHPTQRFVFLSAHIRDGYLSATYTCGGWGYFAKSDELSDIVDGIKELARSTTGTFVISPKVRQRCTPGVTGAPAHRPASPRPQTLVDPGPSTRLQSLTGREVEVLRLIGKGLSRSEIAEELSRSAKTIDGHQERMMKKLSIESRSDLMRFAIREGLAEA